MGNWQPAAREKMRLGKSLLSLFLVLVSFVYMVPLWMVLVNSFKEKRDANLFGLGLPPGLAFRLDNYLKVIKEAGLVKYLMNGLFISGVSTVLIVVFSSMAAFVITRRKGRTTKAVYYYFASGIIIPVAFVPTYMVLMGTGLNNTYLGLMLIYAAIIIPFSIFIFAGFVKTVPVQIDESAIMDGSGPVRLFFEIVLPLLKPATITIIVFSVMNVWNDVQLQLFFASNDKWGLPMSVFKFSSMYYTEWNLIFADIILSMIPVLAVYFVGQKHMVSGLTAGAIKG